MHLRFPLLHLPFFLKHFRFRSIRFPIDHTHIEVQMCCIRKSTSDADVDEVALCRCLIIDDCGITAKCVHVSILTTIFPGEPGLASSTDTKDEGSGGENWSYKTCKAPVKSSPQTNQHNFLQARCPSCCPTNS